MSIEFDLNDDLTREAVALLRPVTLARHRDKRPSETGPVSVQHMVRPFDPCMVCTVH